MYRDPNTKTCTDRLLLYPFHSSGPGSYQLAPRFPRATPIAPSDPCPEIPSYYYRYSHKTFPFLSLWRMPRMSHAMCQPLDLRAPCLSALPTLAKIFGLKINRGMIDSNLFRGRKSVGFHLIWFDLANFNFFWGGERGRKEVKDSGEEVQEVEISRGGGKRRLINHPFFLSTFPFPCPVICAFSTSPPSFPLFSLIPLSTPDAVSSRGRRRGVNFKFHHSFFSLEKIPKNFFLSPDDGKILEEILWNRGNVVKGERRCWI